MDFHRLLPAPGTVDSAELLRDLGLAARAHPDRPYVVMDFAATADGRVAIDGRSGAIGDDGDREIFRRLRIQPDALLVGTGTLEAERYSRAVRRADLLAAREAIGLVPDPPMVTVTRSGRLPLEIPLFQDPAAHVIVYTEAGDAVRAPDVPARVEVHALDPRSDGPLLTAALRHLRHHHGIRSLLCEGGPSLFGGLLGEGLVDELFLTLAPQLSGGGTAPSLTAGDALPSPADLRLVWALERSGSLYLRYAVE